jgi:hypothetical protein
MEAVTTTGHKYRHAQKWEKVQEEDSEGEDVQEEMCIWSCFQKK